MEDGEIILNTTQKTEIERKNRIKNMKDIMRRSNICLNSRRRENREAAIFEEIMAAIFSELTKDTRPDSRKPTYLKKYK